MCLVGELCSAVHLVRFRNVLFMEACIARVVGGVFSRALAIMAHNREQLKVERNHVLQITGPMQLPTQLRV